jgi:hypothetical protein
VGRASCYRVVVAAMADEILSQRARAELAAALRVVDWVAMADGGAEDATIAAVAPARVVRLEAAHRERRARLIRKVRGQ